MTKKLRALDLCAGAGGFSLGFKQAGFRVHAVELDPDAVATHRKHVGPCEKADLHKYHPKGEYDVVFGGVPCQPHSQAGTKEGTLDPRGQLYVPFLRIAVEARAKVVVIENVRGILKSYSPTHGTAFAEIRAAVIAAGFTHFTHAVLNAANYGVPQRRHRVFMFGFRDEETALRFSLPTPTHSCDGGGLFNMKPWVTVREALGLGDGVYAKGRTQKAIENDTWSGMRSGMRSVDVDRPAPTVCSTSAELLDQPAMKTRADEGADSKRRSHRKIPTLRKAIATEPEARSRLDDVAPSVATRIRKPSKHPRAYQKSWGELSEEMGALAKTEESNSTASGSLLDEVAPTVTTNCNHQGFNPQRPSQRKWGQLERAMAERVDPRSTADEYKGAHDDTLMSALTNADLVDRPATPVDTSGQLSATEDDASSKVGAVRMTVAQLAVFQTFPKEFTFVGTIQSQHRQVGNAVPILLARVIGESVHAALLPPKATTKKRKNS